MNNEIKTWQERVTANTLLTDYPDLMKEEIAELRAKVESLAADAERYNAFIGAGLPICFMGSDYNDKASLDAAIDAYRAKEKA